MPKITKEYKKGKIAHADLEAEICSLVRREVDSWEDSTVFVTEKVAFQIRNLIRQLRKNYWGVFDQLVDPATGRKKIWTHLTKSMVEAVVKNIDLDQKDINFRAKRPSKIANAIVMRNAVLDELDNMGFGEILDMETRMKAVDGTGILKTWEEDGHVKTRIVDRLNFYIDPSAYSIQEAESVIERHVMAVDDLRRKYPDKAESLVGTSDVARVDASHISPTTYRGEIKYCEPFERYGKMPKYFLTGNSEDEEMIDGRIVVVRDGNAWKYLECEKWEGWKPYEEDWYTRMPNRWDGEGVAEKVMWEQLYINIIRNIRINRSYVSQLGLFKLRRGSGLTPQMLNRLSTNGIIPVNSMDDIEQLVTQEASPASYNDEGNAEAWARKITSAFESVTGERMPASATATSAAVSQNSAMSQFVLIKEGTGMFLQRWITRHVMPIVAKNLKVSDIVRCGADFQDYDDMLRNIAENNVIERYEDTLQIPPLAEFEMLVNAEVENLKAHGKNIFINLDEEIDADDFDVKVYVTNEEIDKAVIVNNLVQALPMAPEYREQIVKEIFNLFGLNINTNKRQQIAPGMAEMMQGAPASPQLPSAQGAMTEALTGKQSVI